MLKLAGNLDSGDGGLRSFMMDEGVSEPSWRMLKLAGNLDSGDGGLRSFMMDEGVSEPSWRMLKLAGNLDSGDGGSYTVNVTKAFGQSNEPLKLKRMLLSDQHVQIVIYPRETPVKNRLTLVF
ncbi:hypothetical protein WJU16_13210 [Chitinophaga pollutisoli]|uniref:Uncharacterized protein n=1 Tax=Chitinophaga pollutisoli TaxID=3133966 RepID=A0ABZ2YGJ1_9BACT